MFMFERGDGGRMGQTVVVSVLGGWLRWERRKAGGGGGSRMVSVYSLECAGSVKYLYDPMGTFCPHVLLG